MHTPEYLAAEAVLDGRQPAAPAQPTEPLPGRVELKMCELCSRLFTRPTGSTYKYCETCRQKTRMEPFKGQLLRYFELPHHRGSGPYHRTTRAHVRDMHFDPDRKKRKCSPPPKSPLSPSA